MRADGETGNRNVGLHRFRDCRHRRYTEVFPEESMRGENRMLEFAPNTYMLEYQNGAYLCNGTKRVEAPLNLVTLEEAVRQCPKLQQVFGEK